MLYAGQPYGIIAAKSQTIAQMAASKVKLIYPKDARRKPMVTIHDVLASDDKTRVVKIVDWPAKAPPGN